MSSCWKRIINTNNDAHKFFILSLVFLKLFDRKCCILFGPPRISCQSPTSLSPGTNYFDNGQSQRMWHNGFDIINIHIFSVGINLWTHTENYYLCVSAPLSFWLIQQISPTWLKVTLINPNCTGLFWATYDWGVGGLRGPLSDLRPKGADRHENWYAPQKLRKEKDHSFIFVKN